MNNIIAVIVTYNRMEMLKKSIEHILAQNTSCDVIVVDNASTDGTDVWMRNYLSAEQKPASTLAEDSCSNSNVSPTVDEQTKKTSKDFHEKAGTFKVIYENTGANLGGAGGFNYGIRRSYELGYDYIWIMDDDAFVHETTLSELLKIDELLGGPDNYGYLASTVLYTDGTECKMNRHRIHKKYYECFDMLQYGIIPVEASTFISLLLPRRTVKIVGLPIKEYFIWGDDIEYTMRITKKHELRSFMVGPSLLTHAMKQNIGSDISVDDPSRFPNYKKAFRNENHTYREYGFRGFYRYIIRCGVYGLKVFRFSKSHTIKRLSIIVSQFFAGFFFNPKIEYIEDSAEQ